MNSDAKMPLISIIIAIYNIEPYLRECVDSVLRQTYRNLEIILVNDGSTDNSPAMCDEYARKDSRVRVLHKLNGGLPDARNAGFEVASGEYVYFMDGDDYIADTLVADSLAVAIGEQADFVFFDAIEFSEMTDGERKYRPKHMRRHLYAAGRGYVVLSYLMQSGEYRAADWLNFVRAEYIRKYNIRFHKDILSAQDQLHTFLLFLYAQKVVHLNKPLYFYRRRYAADSLSTGTQTAKIYAGDCIVCAEMIKLYQSNRFAPEVQAVIRFCALKYFKYAMRLFHLLGLDEHEKAIVHRQELCQSMRNARYLKKPAMRLYTYRITHLWLKHVDIVKRRIARRAYNQ